MFGVLLSILAHETTTSKYLHRPMKLVFVYGYSPIEYIAVIPTFLKYIYVSVKILHRVLKVFANRQSIIS